eukprot:scaffold9406_cov88-Phaeocystis_antarctica.AAC.1
MLLHGPGRIVPSSHVVGYLTVFVLLKAAASTMPEPISDKTHQPLSAAERLFFSAVSALILSAVSELFSNLAACLTTLPSVLNQALEFSSLVLGNIARVGGLTLVYVAVFASYNTFPQEHASKASKYPIARDKGAIPNSELMTAVAATATAQAATVAVALQCVQLAGRDGHTLRSQTGRLGRAEPSQLLGRRPCSQTGCVAMPLAWAVQPRIAMPVHLRATAPAAAALALELSCSVRPATAHVARVTSPEVDFRLEAQQRALGVCPHRGSPLFTLPSLLPLPPPPALPPQVPQPDAVVDDELSTNYSLESDITCPLNDDFEHYLAPLNDDFEHYLAREGQPIFGFTLNALLGKSGNEEYKAKVTLNLSDAGKKDISSIIFFCHKYNADILIKVLHGPVPQGCGLTSSETKPCFCRRVETDEFMSQYWHINDVLVATTSADLSDALYSYFTKTFPMKPLPMRDKPHLSLLLTPTSVGSFSCFILHLEVHINFVRIFLKLLLPQQRVEPVPSLHCFLNLKETPFPV